MVELRRPADILVDTLGDRVQHGQEWSKTALDVKVINALGQSHFDDSLMDGVAAADKSESAETS